MPHKCVRCSKIFDDGEIDLLKGCPNCGSHVFYFIRKDAVEDAKQKLKELDKISEDKKEEIIDNALNLIKEKEKKGEISEDNKEEIKKETTEKVEEEKESIESVREEKEISKEDNQYIEIEENKKDIEYIEEKPKVIEDETNINEINTEDIKDNNEKTIILDVESIFSPEEGKYELNLDNLFKNKDVVLKEEEGKYIINIQELLK